MRKVQIKHIQCASQCPFYVSDNTGSPFCFIKNALPLQYATASLGDDAPACSPEQYEYDCGGSYENCTFVPLLWQGTELPGVSKDMSSLDDFDPFAEDESEAEPVEQKPAVTEAPSAAQNEGTAEEPALATQVTLHKVTNPYAVKADVLYYPTNVHLEIDDATMKQASRFEEWYPSLATKGPAAMGDVIVVKNALTPTSKLRSQYVFHAVVAGPARLVNANDIRQSIRLSILQADKLGARTMVMIPADCGTHPIYDTAKIQLEIIRDVLRVQEIVNLERIFIVMTDEKSLKVFEGYFDRIFGE